MLEIILLFIIVFSAGMLTWGVYEYFVFKRGEKKCNLYTLKTDENEFVGYEVVDKNGTVHKFIGEQRLLEPYLAEFLKDKKVLNAKK